MDEKLIELAKKIESQIAMLSEQKAKDEKSKAELEKQLAELGDKQAELGRKLLTMQQEAQKKGADEVVKSLGIQFVESKGYADLMEGKVTKATLATITTPAGSVQKDYKDIKGAPELPVTVATAFAHVPTTSNMISFLQEQAFTNSAAETAEGASKPESNITFKEVDAPVKTIAHFIRITKQLAEDAPALAAYINSRMGYGLERRIEKQLIGGDGAGANLAGIFKTGNFTAHGFNTTNMPKGSTELDLIRRCASSMSQNGYRANVVFLNPMDFDTLRGMKDNSGQYLMGSPLQSGEDIRPWGLRVVVSPEITAGKFMVADTTMGATIYDRTAPVIEMFEQDSDNVTKNLYTIRAECRLAFSIESVNCFVGGDLEIGAS